MAGRQMRARLRKRAALLACWMLVLVAAFNEPFLLILGLIEAGK